MTEATLHHVCEGAVVLYKRDGSNTECWYARFKNPKTGKWKKFSTKATDLEKAKQVAQRQFDVRVELIKNNIDIDTKRFSYVADYVTKQLQADIDAGTGKKTYEDYIRVINRFKQFFGNKYIGNITYQDLVEYDQERTRKLGRKAKQSTVNLANVALTKVFKTQRCPNCSVLDLSPIKNDCVMQSRKMVRLTRQIAIFARTATPGLAVRGSLQSAEALFARFRLMVGELPGETSACAR